MALMYTGFWNLIAGRGLSREEICSLSGINSSAMNKMENGEYISTEVLDRLCMCLDCNIEDIVSFAPYDTNNNQVFFRMNSFFSGIGGFDVAFERQGFQTTFLCEINDFCNEILHKHWPEIEIKQDICTLAADEIPNAEVWTGGFPCQDISVARGAAERKGLNGAQSGLFYRYAELIEEKKPRIVIIENVEGLFNSNGGRDFGVILQRMTTMGYSVAWRLLNSRYFGVPQSRPRVYLCCWKNNLYGSVATMFDKKGAFKPVGGTRKDFITESQHANGYPKVPKISYCLAATSGRHTGTDWSRTYVVCADGVRRMTPLEYERLQGFPDKWTQPDSSGLNIDDIDTLRYKAIGNAVSVPVVEWIADRVYKNLISAASKNFSNEDVVEFVPEFKKCTWSTEDLSKIDFSDASQKYVWPKSGVAWKGKYIGGDVKPTPHTPVNSELFDIVEKENVNARYYLTPNAAEGILRRVDNQGRTLFPPLREALEREKMKGN